MKKLELLVHGVIAAVGWLQAWGVFIGADVFSMTPILGGVIPPLVFSVAFILLVAVVITYIEGVVNVAQKYHHKKHLLLK